MPFLRFSRDKRGYEHVYLVHAVNRRGKPSRPRVLYWYRTPPGIKVGRLPFDDEIRRMLEAQYPGIPFDWEAIVSTPIPPVEPEYWRERRRVERAAKQAREIEDVDADLETPDLPAAGGGDTEVMVAGLAEIIIGPGEMTVQADGAPAIDRPPDPVQASQSSPPGLTSRKRRRRGGRGRHGRFADPIRTTGSPASPDFVENPEPQGAEPFEPIEHVEPIDSAEPIQLSESREPTEPTEPVEPTDPLNRPEE